VIDKKSLIVKIDDREYRLRLGDLDADYIRELAAFLDKKIRDIHEQTGIQGEKLLMLVALNLCDEILKGNLQKSPTVAEPAVDAAKPDEKTVELLLGIKKLLNELDSPPKV
jgi:cell division protein ZapA (FtsZ GTPase activity inhibitor)